MQAAAVAVAALAEESEPESEAKSASPSASSLSEQLSRLKKQNEALAKLALDLAADRRAAALRVADLTRRFGHLASQEEEGEEGEEEMEEEEEGEEASTSSPPPISLTFAPALPAPVSLDPGSEPPFDALPWPPPAALLSQAAAAIERRLSSSTPPPSSRRLLVVPERGASPGEPALLLYNAVGGPLAEGSGGGANYSPLRLRVGVNGWADSVEAAAESLNIDGEGEWWGIHLALPRLLASSAAVARRGETFDNNEGRDFSVAVASPFAADEGESLFRAALEASGAALIAARDAALDAAEEAERPGVEASALSAAERAREEYQIDASAAARGKAAALAAERRGLKQNGGAPAPAAAPVAAALAVRGRWGWTSPPQAGAAATLLYCSNFSSPLSGVSESRLVRLHLGVSSSFLLFFFFFFFLSFLFFLSLPMTTALSSQSPTKQHEKRRRKKTKNDTQKQVDSWWQPETRSASLLGPSPSSLVVAMRRVDTSEASRDPLAALALASGDGGSSNSQWWAAEEIPIDPLAARLDFVFSEAEAAAVANSESDPSKAPGLRWDNNAGKDFHTHVSGALEGEALVDAILSETGLVLESEKVKTSALDAAAAAAAEGARARAAAAAARRRRTAQTLFTLPFPPRAGEPCVLYYDPSGSVLRGRTEVAAKGGWNRGRHPTCFAPTRMRPAVPGGGGGGWLRSEEAIDVPVDAWSLDAFVSDVAASSGAIRSGSGGVFSDDAKGSRYHLPVVSSSNSPSSTSPPLPPPLRIAHVAVEAAPAAKVGGMADVVTALARAARDLGHDARIVMPKFDCLDYSSLRNLTLDTTRDFWVGSTKVAVWNASLGGVPTVLLEPQDGSVW